VAEAEGRPPSSDEIQTRLRDLNNFKTRVNWVAGGGAALLALLALGSAGSPGAPRLLSSLVITLVVGAAVPLAYARANFEWATSKIEHALETDPSIQKSDPVAKLPEEAHPWPKRAGHAWTLALCLIILAAVLFLLSIWWWLIVSLFTNFLEPAFSEVHIQDLA
jgi:hypothetical protein